MRSTRAPATGTDIRAAMAHLTSAGITPERVASEVGVTLRTVRRWVAGVQQPRKSNRLALKGWVLDQRHANAMRSFMQRRVDGTLEQAVDALMTDTERAEVAELEARFRRPAAPELRKPSITAAVDPFAVVASARPREVAMFS